MILASITLFFLRLQKARLERCIRAGFDPELSLRLDQLIIAEENLNGAKKQEAA